MKNIELPVTVPQGALIKFVRRKGKQYFAAAWWAKRQGETFYSFHCFSYVYQKGEWTRDSDITIGAGSEIDLRPVCPKD